MEIFARELPPKFKKGDKVYCKDTDDDDDIKATDIGEVSKVYDNGSYYSVQFPKITANFEASDLEHASSVDKVEDDEDDEDDEDYYEDYYEQCPELISAQNRSAYNNSQIRRNDTVMLRHPWLRGIVTKIRDERQEKMYTVRIYKNLCFQRFQLTTVKEAIQYNLTTEFTVPRSELSKTKKQTAYLFVKYGNTNTIQKKTTDLYLKYLRKYNRSRSYLDNSATVFSTMLCDNFSADYARSPDRFYDESETITTIVEFENRLAFQINMAEAFPTIADVVVIMIVQNRDADHPLPKKWYTHFTETIPKKYQTVNFGYADLDKDLDEEPKLATDNICFLSIEISLSRPCVATLNTSDKWDSMQDNLSKVFSRH